MEHSAKAQVEVLVEVLVEVPGDALVEGQVAKPLDSERWADFYQAFHRGARSRGQADAAFHILDPDAGEGVWCGVFLGRGPVSEDREASSATASSLSSSSERFQSSSCRSLGPARP